MERDGTFRGECPKHDAAVGLRGNVGHWPIQRVWHVGEVVEEIRIMSPTKITLSSVQSLLNFTSL